MAVIINASTSAGLQLSSDTSGDIQFQDDGNTSLTIRANSDVFATGNVYASNFFGFGTGFQNMNVMSSQAGVSTQTWTIPNGVKRFKVTLIGAGGQGGGAHAAVANAGFGGGSGAVTIGFFDTVSGVSTASMNVGASPGIGSGITVNANGASGLSSNLNYNGTWIFANGGGGGANSWFGGVSPNAAYGSGGSSSGGTLNLSGNPGGIGGNVSTLATQFASTMAGLGLGGDTPLGFGYSLNQTFNANGGSFGANAAGYGAGGSGGKSGSAATARAGGVGANGVIIIEW